MRNTLMALFAGAAAPLAFAPYGVYPVAVLSLTALFWLWCDSTPKRAAWLGGCFGTGMFAHGVSWVQVSIHQFGLPLYTFSVSLTVLFIAIMTAYSVFAGYCVQRVPARNGTVRLLVFMPIVWVGAEYLRGWLFSGFPWLLLGDSQTDSWLAGFAPVAGAQGVSLIIAIIAALLVYLVKNRAPRMQLIAAMSIVTLIVVGAVLLHIPWTRSAGKIEVALIQGDVPQAIKWDPEHRPRTLELYGALTAPHWRKSIVVWPETAIPAFPDEIPDTLANLRSRANQAGTALLAGIPTGDRRRGPYFNSVVLMNDPSIRYDKHHLVPFGEYLPFDRWLRPVLDFLTIPMSSFARGPSLQAPLEYGALRIGVSICYEDAYAREVTKALPLANILVNVSDDAWFGRSIAPDQHLQIARMRAIETGRYLLRATNTGISAIIDHRGRVVARSPQFASVVVAETAELYEG
ncbi:MAG: apolipoprotein N-acyltransferase, partial [Gammaproteobacteria bacterium]